MPLTEQEGQLLEQAKAVLEHNWTGQFTKPAPSLYPHQWNWDSGFIALAYAHYAPEKARAELRHLFAAQWSNGLVPQIVFRPEAETDGRYFPGADFWQTDQATHAPTNIRTSGITMPPVHGFVLWRIYQIVPDKSWGRELLLEFFPKVLQLHRYLYTHRDPKEEGLAYIQHPWEPGTDNSPLWDQALARIPLEKFALPAYERQDLQHKKAAAHRPTDLDYDRYVYLVDLFRRHRYDDDAIFQHCPFLIQDVLFNSILAWSNEGLLRMAEVLEEPGTEIEAWMAKTKRGLNAKLWNEERGAYDAWDVYSDERIPGITSSGLMPMIAGVPSEEQAQLLLSRLQGPEFSGSPQDRYRLVPTTALNAAVYNGEKYWRGPVWINMNWLLYQGLRRYGRDRMAEQVKRDSLDLLSTYGFYEYFNPDLQVQEPGCGTDAFSWSAALCIDFLLETAK